MLVFNYQETSQADYSGSPPPYGTIPLDHVDNRKEAAELEKRNREWLERHREHHRELKRKRDAHIERIKRHGLMETSPAPGPAPMAANPSNNLTRRTPCLQETFEHLNSISGVANPESNLYRTRRIRLNAGLRKFPLLALSSSKKWYQGPVKKIQSHRYHLINPKNH
ncbi:hypothetical protein E2P81_ATG08206 [Venturia nashicola]|nr:hypothetical protein E2P81_ATG08206 [Venturia nashicola]